MGRNPRVGWGVITALVACALVPAAAQATFPGTNGKIAYEGPGVPGVGSNSIYSMNSDGSGKVNLIPGAPKAAFPRGSGGLGSTDPSYSADGRKIVFESVAQGAGTQDVWIMNADGSGRVNLTNTFTVRETDPALSPDGSKIVFSREPDSGGTELFVMNADGSGATPLSGSAALQFPGRPDFSPDGSKIAFEAYNGTSYDIYTLNANGQALTNLTSGVPGDSFAPSWSPDGTRIAFSNQGTPPAEGNILVIGAGGASLTDLTSSVTGATVGDPAFSPDGTLIAYSRDDSPVGNADIFTMSSSDGGGQTNITADTTADLGAPSWGPAPDTAPPETTITKQPKAETEKTKAKLAFTSSEPGSTFECALKGKGVDAGLKTFKPCDSGKAKYKQLEPGKKKFQVRATDAAGNVEATPAKAKWKVLAK